MKQFMAGAALVGVVALAFIRRYRRFEDQQHNALVHEANALGDMLGGMLDVQASVMNRLAEENLGLRVEMGDLLDQLHDTNSSAAVSAIYRDQHPLGSLEHRARTHFDSGQVKQQFLDEADQMLRIHLCEEE